MSPPATANSTETLFGAENVRSSAATFEPAVIGRSTVPSIGCTPRISAMKPSPSPDPPASIPSARSPAPSQTPGVSPRLA
jgi:hypothetical protein